MESTFKVASIWLLCITPLLILLPESFLYVAWRFDVKLTAEYPDDSEGAEAVRMNWLTAWLASRKACLNGYDIVERREFEYMEHNPARYDLRYKVRCTVPMPDTAG